MEFQDKSLALTTRDLIANYIIGFQLFPISVLLRFIIRITSDLYPPNINQISNN